MEGSSKPANHESRKPLARTNRGEIRGVRVVINQKHKHRGDSKLVRDVEVSSLNMDKGKQNEPRGAVLGDVSPTKDGAASNATGLKDSELNLQEGGQTRAKLYSPQAGSIKQLRAAKAEPSPLKSKPEESTRKQNPNGELKELLLVNGPVRSINPPAVIEDKSDGQQKTPVLPSTMNKSSDQSLSTERINGDTNTTGESTLAEQELGLKQAEERLQRDCIYRLVRRSPDFPSYQYLCRLCSIHIENVQGAHKHIKEKRHKKNILEKQEENELRSLPPPTMAQIDAISVTLIDTAKEYGISQEDFILRQDIVNNMEEIIQMKLPECSLRMYGSSLTRFALKTSDINIDVKFPPKLTQQNVLIKVLEILKNCTCYTDVESDFHAKVPVVFCNDKNSGLTCKVSAGNETACLTTELLTALGKLEPVLTPLVVVFRYWARLCHIDSQMEGGIPSYCFALMVVYFLQKRPSPILPAYLGSWIEGYDSRKLDEYHLQGVSEGKYVDWEHKQPSPTDSKNSLAVDNGIRADPNHRKAGSEGENGKNKIKQRRSPLVFEQTCQVATGQLWLELLKFYTLDFDVEDYVISVRVHDVLSRDNKNWPRRRIAIEDPFATKRNVARSLNSQMVHEYIQERFRGAYRYFACPQSKARNKSRSDIRKKGKLHGLLKPKDHVVNGSLTDDEPCDTMEQDETGKDMLECNGPAHWGQCKDERDLSDEFVRDRDESDSDTDILSAIADFENTTENRCNSRSLEANCLDSCTNATSLHHEALKDEGSLSEDDLYYVFDKFILTSGKPPTIVCSICKRDGHSKEDCPEDFKKIELKPLPPMNDIFLNILDSVCRRCYENLSPNPCEQQNREQILAYLERFIRKEFNGNARLCLFGSSKNGFGFRDSDLDICMTLEGHENAEKLNCKEIIEGLAKVLKRHPGLKNILPITTAKVPIVKFEHKESGMEGDISLYNTLAQYNTRMLATYAAIDPRVKYLGYAVKFFAKRCDIGDASRGSLSSYAYILMVLYFLQQRNPPVIPVLQEIYDGPETPKRMVDGWNAFFYENTEELRSRFPYLGQNKESVGELWLGFLRFYTEEFDFKEYVISIRQKKLLTTFEKQWTSKCIAIEDPFDLNHNLGAGVSRKMTIFIMKAFINGRKRFGTPYYPHPGHEDEYFFDSKVLTDGEHAPNDRCCRVCGKIGHYMKDCPKRKRIKKKENERDDDRDIKEDDRDHREKRCFTCGDVGHVRRDCPENNPIRQKNMLTSQLLHSLISPQPVLASLQQLERPSCPRQPSDLSESHPSYSPQPQPFQQNSMNQKQQNKHGAQKPHQVPRPAFNFQHTPHYPALHNLGLLSLHPQIIPNNSWPIHNQMLQSSVKPPHSGVKFSARSGSSSPSTNQSAINLNDPSIIFAQPAARSLGAPNSTRDGLWHNSQNPNSLMSNGTVGSTDQGFQGPFGKPSPPWEHGNAPHYPLIQGSLPYNLPQNLLHQGAGSYHSKAYYPQAASLIQNGTQFPLLSQGHPHLKSSYIHQKK
ncbi:terminal uridylyltransferase 4 isoform X2 [Pelobates cultripes]|uniref:RNA uridylyltransferase n=1 Tax=Pelobates cultripes TaxID=61616 RepID=A0AAD1SXN9_PELCU|nr:terminal uridylyltransferase 4 isoform X2 [Pelobates cultripes]